MMKERSMDYLREQAWGLLLLAATQMLLTAAWVLGACDPRSHVCRGTAAALARLKLIKRGENLIQSDLTS